MLAYQDGLGHRRIEVATTLQTLASAELLVGKGDDAIPQLRDALAIDEAIYGHDNIEVARVQSALAVAQSATGDNAGSLATDEQALELAKRTAGEDSDLYAMILGQLAGTLTDLGRPKEAIPYLDRALVIQTAKLGPGHVQTLTLMLTKCAALQAAHDVAGAVAMCRNTLAVAEGSLGKTSPLLFLFLAHTGETLIDAKQPKDASAMLERALALRRVTDPSDLYYVAMLDARALWDANNHKRAVELATKARDGFAKLGDAKRDQMRDADDWLAHHQ